jgi:hypothetical protein
LSLKGVYIAVIDWAWGLYRGILVTNSFLFVWIEPQVSMTLISPYPDQTSLANKMFIIMVKNIRNNRSRLQDSNCSEIQSDCSTFTWTGLPYYKYIYIYIYGPHGPYARSATKYRNQEYLTICVFCWNAFGSRIFDSKSSSRSCSKWTVNGSCWSVEY